MGYATMTVHDDTPLPGSVVGVDIRLVLVLAAVLEALLGGAILLPLSASRRTGRGPRCSLEAVAGGSKRHP